MKEEFTHQESLAVIESMIASSRNRVKDDGRIYILWAAAVTLAALYEYVMIQLQGPNSLHWIGWPIAMPLAGIGTGLLVYRQKTRANVHTHFEETMKYLWLGVGVMLLLLIFMSAIQKLAWSQSYPLFIGLYGVGTFVSGGLLKLKAMQVGASICWVLAVISALTSFENQLILLTLSIWVSYLIPGIILNRKASGSDV